MAAEKRTVTCKIPVGKKGLVALVDDADFAVLSSYRWFLNGPYTEMEVSRGGVRFRLRMHNLLMNPDRGQEADHINRDGLDNRRCNLRVATRSQNSANRSNHRKGGYRGVYLLACGVFEVRLSVRPKCHYVGRFRDEIEAARAYDAAAVKAFGEFAQLNFPEAIAEAA